MDPEKAWSQLRTKVQDAQGSLPADANQPIVNDDLIIHLLARIPFLLKIQKN